MLVNLGLIRVALLTTTNAQMCDDTQCNNFAAAFAWYSHGIRLGSAEHVDRPTLTGNTRDRVQCLRTTTE
ncbi:BgtTE-56052 [Blumeria graminis f. sp. tritici]|uniref:BgtTE-56052 n=1 Tax=Blumeria graminis f. sp. tritici TaxID=62690 RepID=A0A9X9QBY8_BLUGR|nr:BgtTE-56052 [Blumeria graminis f. sp. tritici]